MKKNKKPTKADVGPARKLEHIELCRTKDVESSDRFTGFSEVSLMPKSIPACHFSELKTDVDFLGVKFSWPLLITGMTGGVKQGTIINQRLALAAQEYGIPMGVGSQRVAIEDPKLAKIFNVKKYAPKLFVIGNLGFAQLYSRNAVDLAKQAAEMIDADALAIHFNLLQELVQAEGDRKFGATLEQIARIVDVLKIPVIVKEVGAGLDCESATKLIEVGVAALDVGGSGGTSWPYIEGLRQNGSESRTRLGETFRNWGIPTAYALAAIRNRHREIPLIATGGIRSGLDVAKAIGLGAQMVGIGLPLMKAAVISPQKVLETLQLFGEELKIAMLGCGATNLIKIPRATCYGRPYADELKKRIVAIHRQ